MPLRLGPLTIPWPVAAHRDDPYWDLFINRPVADPNNLVSHLMAMAPEGNVNPAKADLHSPEITAAHIKEFAAYLGADFVGIVDGGPASERPYAIVCGVKAEYDPATAPGVGGQAPAVDSQYVSFIVAAYIRELGYRATSATDPDAATLAARAGLPANRSIHVAEVIRTDLPLAADA